VTSQLRGVLSDRFVISQHILFTNDYGITGVGIFVSRVNIIYFNLYHTLPQPTNSTVSKFEYQNLAVQRCPLGDRCRGRKFNFTFKIYMPLW